MPVPREGEHGTHHETPSSPPPMAFPPPKFHPEGATESPTSTLHSPSPLLNEDTNKDSISSFSPGIVAQSAAEKAREKKLRDDPMAIVIGPLYVDCRRCGTRIKLSAKSLYDACHWRTHRSRCLKRHSAWPKKRIAKADIAPSPKRSQPPQQPHTPPPPLVVETPERQILGHNHASSSPLYPITPPNPRTADAIFEEYLLRSHGKKHVPRPLTHWQDWSWSQLRHPRFTAKSPSLYYDDNDDDFYMSDADSHIDDSLSAAVP
ncbi:hypothetical protein D9615_007412 [Tricholomella constricta]|uniref:Uncharacterized protein n=1 Tax=Tricholomella constricta TaxID=117010 RepID=A0A8H5LXR3_9AGAR|nr:hypothetical protein D9615_007412 [Tricholomella constricta]